MVTTDDEILTLIQKYEDYKIKSPLVLKAFLAVKRDEFVDEKIKTRAYEDNPLPIGHGQTISQPFIVAYMTQLLNPKPQDKILEIGTGSGYQAAILANIAKDVYTVERIAALADQAQNRFRKLHLENIHSKTADGYYGWQDQAPFDGILVTAASEEIPQPLIDQLKVDGKLVIPIGPPFSFQELVLVTKLADGTLTKEYKMPVSFVPFQRETEH